MELPVLRFGVRDSQGDIFAPGCFREADGKTVPVLAEFDSSRMIGYAKIRATDDELIAEIDQDVLDNFPYEPSAAAGYTLGVSKVNEGTRTVSWATLQAIGLVRPDQKVN